MIPILSGADPFPPLSRALTSPNGLLAAGADLTTWRLLQAYRQGIFPWFNEGDPILWWSPDPRMVLFPEEIRVSRSLSKTLRNKEYDVRVDSAFAQVIDACAGPRQGADGTWITMDIRNAYSRLHELGWAHSIEVWSDGALQGGLYGIGIGLMFYGESMFSHSSDASKIALVYLARQLQRWGFGMIDCQMNTAHLASMGAREIPRKEFAQKLQELVDYGPGTDAAQVPAQGGTWRFELEAIRAGF